ncbi:hypothetical protein [Pollutibacter soli]|uniref:hypothetical protein n=1 Tax=Pollutibacter soli TaxID=3034157 RepID=UPI0030140595
MIIGSKDSCQFQIDKQSGAKDEYRVYRIKECEYKLMSLNNSMHRIRVKGTDGIPGGYTVIFFMVIDQSEKPMKMFSNRATSITGKP